MTQAHAFQKLSCHSFKKVREDYQSSLSRDEQLKHAEGTMNEWNIFRAEKMHQEIIDSLGKTISHCIRERTPFAEKKTIKTNVWAFSTSGTCFHCAT